MFFRRTGRGKDVTEHGLGTVASKVMSNGNRQLHIFQWISVCLSVYHPGEPHQSPSIHWKTVQVITMIMSIIVVVGVKRKSQYSLHQHLIFCPRVSAAIKDQKPTSQPASQCCRYIVSVDGRGSAAGGWESSDTQSPVFCCWN